VAVEWKQDRSPVTLADRGNSKPTENVADLER